MFRTQSLTKGVKKEISERCLQDIISTAWGCGVLERRAGRRDGQKDTTGKDVGPGGGPASEQRKNLVWASWV